MAFDQTFVVATVKSGSLPLKWERYQMPAGTIAGGIVFILFWMVLMTVPVTFFLLKSPSVLLVIFAAIIYPVDLAVIFFTIPRTLRQQGTVLILTPEGFVVWNQRTDVVNVSVDYQQCDFLTSNEDTSGDGPSDFYIRYRIRGQESRWQIPNELKGKPQVIADHIVNAYAISHPQSLEEDAGFTSPINLNVAGFYGHIVPPSPAAAFAIPRIDRPFNPFTVLQQVAALSPDPSWKIYPADFTPRVYLWMLVPFIGCPLVLCCGFLLTSMTFTVNATTFQIPGWELWAVGIILVVIALMGFVRPLRNRDELRRAQANNPLSQGTVIVLTPEGFVCGNPMTGKVINYGGYDQASQISIVLRQGVTIVTIDGRTIPISFTSYFRPNLVPILGTEIVQAFQRYSGTIIGS